MTKKLEEMKGSELVAEYNRLAIPKSKPPVKRFATTKDAIRRIKELAPATKKEKKTGMEGLCGEFGCREGTHRAKLVAYLGKHKNKELDRSTLIEEVYGKKEDKLTTPLMMVLKGARVMIDKNKLPYKVIVNDKKISLKDA